MRIHYAVLLAMLTCATGAAAQQDPHPCLGDARKFCASVQAGGGRIRDCLREHQADLTPACRAVVANALPGPMAAWAKSCEADVDKLCKDVPVGKGRVIRCLRSHSDQLSPSCKAALDEQARQRAAGKTAAPAGAGATPAPTKKK